MWQREFFRLAAVWLACRQDLLALDGEPFWRFLGEMDYHAEMGLLVREVRQALDCGSCGDFIKQRGATASKFQ
jgi:hypothetical protein